MNRNVRPRFCGEAAASAASAGGLVVTLVWPDWIEFAFGADPDRGSGLVEWLIVVVSFLVLVCASRLARLEWRRSAPLDGRRPATSRPGSIFRSGVTS